MNVAQNIVQNLKELGFGISDAIIIKCIVLFSAIKIASDQTV